MAAARWGILAKAIRSSGKQRSESGSVESESVRSFQSFEIFKILAHGDWHEYRHPLLPAPLFVRIEKKPVQLSDMIGFNNTGNICVWPSEEILADYCLQNFQEFSGKSICEIGAGMTGLAALCVAIAAHSSSVLITDGNTASVENLRVCIERNSACLTTTVSASELAWTKDSFTFLDPAQLFDIILCADCLFFLETHRGLVRLIRSLLNTSVP